MNDYSDTAALSCDNFLPEKGCNDQPKPRLLDQVRNVIRLKHYSIRTEQSYIDWIKRYIFFHGKKHPSELDEQHISAARGVHLG